MTSRKPTNGELPPFDDAAERGALGCVILAADDGSQDPRDLLDRLEPDFFYDVRHQTVFSALSALAQDSQPLTSSRLDAWLRDHSKTGDAGGNEYLQKLPEEAVLTARFPEFLERVADRALRRAAIRDATELKRIAQDPTIPAKTIGDASRRMLESHGTNSTDDLKARLAARAFNILAKPPELPARYFINGIPICTPGNLTAISAAPKAGKSAFSGAMMAAAMAVCPEECDCLGVTSSNPERFALIHLDTEQSPLDHWRLIERTLRRAGISEPPHWLLSYCITGFDLSDARRCIHVALETGLELCGGVHSLILDGGADLVGDVNDPRESNGFVTELHALAIKFACPTVGVIHLNPGTEKTRGHLGSQLERKAETNLRLERDEDAFLVWSDKNRNAPIPRESGPRFAWNTEAQMHVSVESAGDAKSETARNQELPMVESIFRETKAWEYSKLVATVMSVVGKTSRTAERRIEKWRHLDLVRKTNQGFYVSNT